LDQGASFLKAGAAALLAFAATQFWDTWSTRTPFW
jgi:hypothetical protein